MSKNLKRLGVLTTLTAVVCALVACSETSTPTAQGEEAGDAVTQVKLISTISFNSGLNPLVVNGDFPEEEFGLDFVSVDISDAGSSNQMAALLSGEADIASIGINTAIDAIIGGADVKIISASAAYQGGFVAANRAIEDYGVDTSLPPLEQLAQFKGATFGAGPAGSAGNNLTRAVLLSAGLDPDKDVNLVPLADTGASVAPGLEQGTYDVTFAPLGAAEIAVERGTATTIVSIPQGHAPVLEGIYPTVVITTTKLLNEQPELVQKIRDTYVAATELVYEDPALASEIIKQSYFPDMDESLFAASWDLAQSGYPRGARFTESDLEAFIRVFDEFSDHDYSKLVYEDVASPIAKN